ncbi:protein timeless homolog [Anguilla anguilla]|uniref:protein timeless homolog n=1 Tax=Anguilla anguilla TaxID=7936 RepID=UPI0015A77A22|nr:protein timeless homolog [Anguilla anguilla]XP_035244176.1 protein timeless homolog [Anguilla anguilla]XP_035244177.1 protein timeless homolog [Anguilla anguilla]XP_035244178.1 protein timeless homolog [Anguilla anguilla]
MDLYMMNCELLATCSALGFLEGDTYHREPDCLESVKDLIRYLRHEDDTRDIRQQLGAGQILQNDLLPIITQHHQDKPLFDACIRLMVNLTQPALLCFGKVPDDPAFRHHFLQVVSYLQAYKEAFANEKVFTVLSETLYNLLQLEWEQRQEEDNLLIERILLLVRNVLHIPADPYEEKNVDDDASVHDKLLWAVHMSGLDDLFKFLASAQSEQQWSLHVLEVVSLMFRDQTPELLVSAGQARSAQEKQKDHQELEALRQKELAAKRTRNFQRGTRHSRFGGSYVVQGLKSIGENDVIYHRGLHNFKNYTHDMGKAVRRVPKRQMRARDREGQRRSALSVRLFLREFCIDFLENCYNRLMYLVKESLVREQAQQHDETYYLWALSFFMAFNRGHNFRPDLVSETMSIRAFHFIERNITNYYEMMLTDRKEATSWSRRMHLALKAYQELLLTVNEMDRSRDENIRQGSNVIKSNIFYLMEYREIFLTLLRKFDETKQPRSFLRDLVETTHLFLRMLERFCKGRRNLVVQKKKTKRRRSHGKKKPQVEHTPEHLEETWQVVSEELRNAGFQLSASLTEGAVPFDAASDTPMEEQRTEAMVRVQDALLARLGPEALGLLRAAREVWPEGDVFGSTDVEPEEELQLLKQILFAELPRSAPTDPVIEDEEGGGDMEEEEEVESVHVSETEFNFLDYIKRFASPNIVRPYLLLLKTYLQNTPHTNHCITRMLHRLAVDLKMEALLFQLSVFWLFDKILGDPAAAAYKELVTFAKFVLNRFFALAAQNDKAFVELLFWKNVGAVREMTEGYTKPGEGNRGEKRVVWTQEEEEELRRVYEEYRDSGVPDVVETILPLLSNTTRTRRQVVAQMVHMGLVGSVKDLKRERKGTRIVLWTEEQELELETLFEEYQNSDDVLGNILKRLTARRSRARVVDKMLSMGLVSDRKELYKKRRRTAPGKSTGMSEEEFFSDLAGGVQDEPSDIEEEEEDSEEEDGSGRSEDEGEEERGARQKGSRGGETPAERNASVAAMVHALREEGMAGPLLWLQNCLNRTADDREEEGLVQAVPLVPLMEENEDAMETASFQRLLRKLGVRAPADEQESFWRIPAKLRPSQLRAAASWLSQDVGAGERGAQEEQGSPAAEPEGGSDDVEQRAQVLRALLLARKRKRPTAAHTENHSSLDDLESTSDGDTPRAGDRGKVSAKRSRVLDSDEEREEDSSAKDAGRDVDPDSDEEAQSAPSKRRRQRAFVFDEDED